MKENVLRKNNTGLFLLLAAFFFARTALLSPVHCFLMKSDYPYFRFSVGGVCFIILLVVFSLLSSKLAFVFREKAGEIAAIVYIIAMSDPLFFATQDNPFKLLLDIIIELFILYVISDKKVVPAGAVFPVVLFAATFLVPFSILGYVPLMLSVFVLVARSSKQESKYVKTVLIGAVCAVAGFLFNKVLMSRVQVFNEWYTSLSFADITEITKRLRFALAFIPVVIFGSIFFRHYQKNGRAFSKNKNERNKSYEAIADAAFLPAVISAVSAFFLEAESFCVINLIVPTIIIALLYLKDGLCIKTVDSIANYVKEHKMLSFIIVVAVFALALKGAQDYYPLRQLIFYIIY